MVTKHPIIHNAIQCDAMNGLCVHTQVRGHSRDIYTGSVIGTGTGTGEKGNTSFR
jgi:hypothetical protein